MYYNTMNYIKTINLFIISLFVISMFSMTVVSASDNETVTGEPDINIDIDNDNVTPGIESQRNLTIENTGFIQQEGEEEFENIVTTAENLSISLNSNSANVTPEYEDIETLPKNESVDIPVLFETDRNHSNGFDLTVEIDYNYTSEIKYDSVDNTVLETVESSESIIEIFNFDTNKVPNIVISEINSNISVNENGKVGYKFTNEGTKKAKDININLLSQNPRLNLDDTDIINELDIDESKELFFDTAFSDTASENSDYKFKSNISYTYNDDISYTEINTYNISPEKERNIGISISENDLYVGDKGKLILELENTNNITLSDSTVNVYSDSTKFEIEPTDKSQYIGDFESKDTKKIFLDISFLDNINEDLDYKINLDVEYKNENENIIQSDFTISPNEERNFDVTVQDNSVPVNGFGDIDFELDNKNNEDFDDVDISFDTRSSSILFNSEDTTYTQRIGSFSDTEQFSVRANALSSASKDKLYTLEYVITYTDKNDITNVFEDKVDIVLEEEQDIDVSFKNNNVSERSNTDLKLNVSNFGPKDLKDIELTVQARNDITIKNSDIRLDELDAHGNSTVIVPIETPLNPSSYTQNIDLILEYTYDELPNVDIFETVETIYIDEIDSEFSVNISNNTITQGEESTVRVEVTNNLNESVKNVDVDFSATSPLSVSDSSSYIDKLSSGESRYINATVSSSGSATPNSYPLDVDFKYDNENGDSQLSEIYTVSINVVESDDSFISPIVIVILITFGAVGGGIYYIKRIKNEN